MELNDRVRVTLTQAGANALNEQFRQFKERNPLTEPKTDYQAGDKCESELWAVFSLLKEDIGPGLPLPFKELQKV